MTDDDRREMDHLKETVQLIAQCEENNTDLALARFEALEKRIERLEGVARTLPKTPTAPSDDDVAWALAYLSGDTSAAREVWPCSGPVSREAARILRAAFGGGR